MIGFEWLIPIITNKFSSYVAEIITREVEENSKDKLKKAIKNKLNKIEWRLFCKNYYKKIEEDYGKITLLLSGEEKVSLENFYVDVYLSDRSFWSDYRRISGRQILIAPDDTHLITRDVLDFIYIEGHPGMGKTTFLKYAAFLASQGLIKKVPIFVNLLDWSISKLSLMDFLINEFDICGFPEADHLINFLLKEGEVIILFDGLDEVTEENGRRLDIAAEIQKFCRKYKSENTFEKDGNKFLITCRIAATKQNFHEFTYFRLAEFSDEQIILLIEKWFVNKNKQLCKNLKQELFKEEHHNILELARQPLLLLMICYSFYTQKGEFPKNKVDIYETSIDALLNEWDAKKGLKRRFYEDLPINARKFVLSKIAYDNFSENDQDFSKFKKTYLENTIAEQIAEMIGKHKRLIPSDIILQDFEAQHGILIETEERIYRFPHLSFQEYFAAKYIVEEKLLEQLLIPENINQDRWREVILNASILSNHSNNFFDLFLNAADKIIRQDAELVTFLNHVNEKAVAIQADKKISSIRFFYCYLMLVITDNINTSVVHSRSVSYEKDYEFIRNFGKSLISLLDSEIGSILYRFVTSNFTAIFECSDELHFSEELDLDYQLFLFFHAISKYTNEYNTYSPQITRQRDTMLKIVGLWKKLAVSDSGISEDLKKESVDFEFSEDDFADRLSFDKKLASFKVLVEKVVQSKGIKPNLTLNHSQIQKLIKYFQANQFFFEILNPAMTSNNKEMENKILLPLQNVNSNVN